MRNAYIAWRYFQNRFLQYCAALLLLGATLLALLEVVRRYVFGQSFPWQQDAVTFGILCAVFLFFSIVQSRNLHLRVTLVLTALRHNGSERARLAVNLLELFGALLGLGFCVYLVLRGLPVAERMVLRNRMTESLVLPLWPFFIVFLTGMAFTAVSFLFQVYSGILVLLGRDQNWPKLDDEDGGQPIL